MNRHQLSFVIVLALIGLAAALISGTAAQAGDWTAARDDGSGSALSGTLYRNSADQNGSAPYLLLDKWGVVRGYVAAGQGVDLEARVGQQVNLQGTVRTLPGGDMPYITCDKVNGVGGAAATPAPEAPGVPACGSRHRDSAATASQAESLPLREVVLEPQSADPDANNQDSGNGTVRRRTDPQRARPAGVRSMSYQETVPTPAPTAAAHGAHAIPDPAADPGPAMEGGPMTSEGPMESEGPMVGRFQGGCESCDDGPCGVCGNCCDDYDYAWGPHGPLFCIGPTGLWAKADYLLWTESGMHVPALVTQGSDADAHPGALGQPGTTILYGNDTIDAEARSGFRLQAGVWLNRCATIGFEGEFVDLADENSNFYQWSDGNPLLARPVNDAATIPSQPRAELVSYPRNGPTPLDALDGSVAVNASTQFYGADARFLITLCRQDGCWTDDCSCMTYHDRYRAIFTVGYRYLYLADQLGINERLTTSSGSVQEGDTTVPGTAAFAITDDFNTRNTFNGAELGLKFEAQRNRWGLELFPRIGLGSTHTVVTIAGKTVATDTTGAETTTQSGLLAQSTTNGAGSPYTANSFSVVPELDLNLNYQLTPHAKFVVGYTFLYWNNVARAGDQINTTINSTTLPGSPVAATGDTTQPRFNLVETGFWTQGLNVGLDCRW